MEGSSACRESILHNATRKQGQTTQHRIFKSQCHVCMIAVIRRIVLLRLILLASPKFLFAQECIDTYLLISINMAYSCKLCKKERAERSCSHATAMTCVDDEA